MMCTMLKEANPNRGQWETKSPVTPVHRDKTAIIVVEAKRKNILYQNKEKAEEWKERILSIWLLHLQIYNRLLLASKLNLSIFQFYQKLPVDLLPSESIITSSIILLLSTSITMPVLLKSSKMKSDITQVSKTSNFELSLIPSMQKIKLITENVLLNGFSSPFKSLALREKSDIFRISDFSLVSVSEKGSEKVATKKKAGLSKLITDEGVNLTRFSCIRKLSGSVGMCDLSRTFFSITVDRTMYNPLSSPRQ